MTATHELRFLVLALPNVPWGDFLASVENIEDLGFDVVGVADHFVDWTNPPRPWFEAWTLLGAMARETKRIRITTTVSQIPLRPPAMFARQALTVDHLSDGRLELGLGIGLPIDPSYEMMGVPNWTPKERVDRFGEYVEIVDRMLSNEVTTFNGRYYEVEGAVMNPRPVQSPRPPLTIAAMGTRMLKLTARYADIWNSLSFSADFEEQLEETRARVALLDEHCAALGREPASLRRSYMMFDANARPSGGSIAYYESENLFVNMVQRVTALGISEIGLYYPALDAQLPKFERIAKEVIPQLKADFAARAKG